MEQTEQIDSVELVHGEAPDATVIWLHGLGADGNDFVPIVQELNLPATISVRFIFPHAPVRPVTINGGLPMRAWYDIKSMEFRTIEDETGIRESAKFVNKLIAQERERGIKSERIVVAGFSQGGAIALHTGLRHSETLAGIMALSTYLPLRDRLREERSAANESTSVFMAHGTMDPTVAYAWAARSRDALQQQGYAVEWHEYLMQHSVSPQEISDIAAWLKGVFE